MKRLNTHAIYIFALRIHPLTILEYTEGMTLKDVLWTAIKAEAVIRAQLGPQLGFFSPSLKRSAGALLRAIYDLGFPPDNVLKAQLDAVVRPYRLNAVAERAKEFETVLANELPGLATYWVSRKGIYSTDDLISHAEMHVPEKCRSVLSLKAKEDVQQAGKCLAFEVSTASAFHMWRAVESVMDSYHHALRGKTFLEAEVVRNWARYIEALVDAKAEKKITSFLDHIREEYHNPISHPDDTLELDEAFGLFGAALSVIGQMLRAILEIKTREALTEAFSGEPSEPLALSSLIPQPPKAAGTA